MSNIPVNKNVPMLMNSRAPSVPSMDEFLGSFGVSVSLSRECFEKLCVDLWLINLVCNLNN